MATLAQIDAKIDEAVAASETGDFAVAALRAREAALYIASYPDKEFDGQKVVWREKADLLKNLIAEYEAKATQSVGDGGIKNIRVIPTPRSNEY